VSLRVFIQFVCNTYIGEAITYSVISPLINGLAFGTFFAFYQLYKYLFLWIYEQKPSSDTGGLFFPKAIQQVFVGLYIEEVSFGCGSEL